MEQQIKKAATDIDWDVIYVNISSCCSSSSSPCLIWSTFLLDFYSQSHTPPWLQAAPLIEYIVSQAAADSQRKLWDADTYLVTIFSAPSLPYVCYTSPPFKVPCKAFHSIVCWCCADVCFHLFSSADSNSFLYSNFTLNWTLFKIKYKLLFILSPVALICFFDHHFHWVWKCVLTQVYRQVVNKPPL